MKRSINLRCFSPVRKGQKEEGKSSFEHLPHTLFNFNSEGKFIWKIENILFQKQWVEVFVFQSAKLRSFRFMRMLPSFKVKTLPFAKKSVSETSIEK